jgi:4-aminobutyrate aminotransferase-like enzyme
MDRSRKILEQLRTYESRNVTFLEPDGSWPVVWTRARGVHVWDANGRKYVDLTAAFGVAAAGHANPRVVLAGQRQMRTLLHAMGDVHPHPLKADLARELSRWTFERWGEGGKIKRSPHASARVRGKTIFGNSGFEAVEAALKTARLATGKPGVIAFTGGYHGLGYGALNTTHREHFRGPFQDQLGEFGHFVEFPIQAEQMLALEAALDLVAGRERIGAVLVEPVQGRAGIRVPPPEFLPFLRRWCDKHRVLLVADEIYTGFGRTGRWFACEHWDVTPDVICLGKALTGGFPLSACVGRADLMDAAWPASTGEAIHTSTFLGHPVGCAMALAQLREIHSRQLVQKSAASGAFLRAELESVSARWRSGLRVAVRGLGLMVGIELLRPDGAPAGEECMRVVKALLERGYIVLPEGEAGQVISLTPPLTITRETLRRCVRVLAQVLAKWS